MGYGNGSTQNKKNLTFPNGIKKLKLQKVQSYSYKRTRHDSLMYVIQKKTQNGSGSYFHYHCDILSYLFHT